MKKVRNKKIDGRFYTDEYINRLVKKIYQLEDRINKAIEYMELKTIVHKTYCLDRDEMKVLLDILRGNNE